MGEGECELLPEEHPKKSRHRKKHLYNTILQQMEFYFSDSNLSKDRFLSQLLSESSYVNIDVFLKFNKIKKLNCTVEDIQKAIKKSDLIEISEDGQKVYRTKPIKVKENVDFCTIYVENIKADANHVSLSQIFSDFGVVVYVSIPKYKHNKANKGFAFIEYETEEQANTAILFFDSIGCKIPSEKNPEKLQSIMTFESGVEEIQNKEYEAKIKVEVEEYSSNQKNNKASEGNVKKRKLSAEEEETKKLKNTGASAECFKKLKLSTEEEDGQQEHKEISKENLMKKEFSTEEEEAIKKQKNNEATEEHLKKRRLSSEDGNKKKKNKEASERDLMNTEKEEANKKQKNKDSSEENVEKWKLSSEEKDGTNKQKTNKENKVLQNLPDHKSKIKKEAGGEEHANQADECEDAKKKKKNKKEKRKNYIRELGMQILAKKEWKKLRNSYLELQRKKMKEFKQYLYRQKYGQKPSKKNDNEEIEEKYFEQKEFKEPFEEVKKINYTPGVIVKLRLSEPCIDVKKLKNEIKSISPEVQYVDIPLPAGSEEVFIRFSTEVAASEFCSKEFNGEKSVMEGDEEKSYWEKIETDRAVKFNKLAKKQRGREKLLKKAEKESAKHLRFEENE